MAAVYIEKFVDQGMPVKFFRGPLIPEEPPLPLSLRKKKTRFGDSVAPWNPLPHVRRAGNVYGGRIEPCPIVNADCALYPTTFGSFTRWSFRYQL